MCVGVTECNGTSTLGCSKRFSLIIRRNMKIRQSDCRREACPPAYPRETGPVTGFSLTSRRRGQGGCMSLVTVFCILERRQILRQLKVMNALRERWLWVTTTLPIKSHIPPDTHISDLRPPPSQNVQSSSCGD